MAVLKEWKEDWRKVCCIGQFEEEAILLLSEKYYGTRGEVGGEEESSLL
jgi:hypothetical protein